MYEIEQETAEIFLTKVICVLFVSFLTNCYWFFLLGLLKRTYRGVQTTVEGYKLSNRLKKHCSLTLLEVS